MKLRGIDRSTACVVTQTVVDPADPAFQNPTKPVGAFLSEEEAKAKAAETGWTFKEDAGRGWRQVVASPKPVRIVEFDAVKDLMDGGYVVVSTGGGGVPVFEKEGLYEGVPAVIDKDRSSAKLAADFGADMLVILTAVEKVCVNFGKPDQAEIDTMTIAEAEEFIAQGQFAPGSMLPKVEPASSTCARSPRQGSHHVARVRRCRYRRQDGHRHHGVKLLRVSGRLPPASARRAVACVSAHAPQQGYSGLRLRFH